MAEYPTPEQLRDPNYVMPAEFGAPQDRGESAPAANPAPGPGNETEPRTDLKEFVVVPADPFDSDGKPVEGVSDPKPVKEPASKAGGTDLPKK